MQEFLKVKVKSLAAESKIIRLEEIKAKQRQRPELRSELYLHRILAVRPEARASHLAYGFLRGVSYRAIEKEGSRKPNWDKVKKIVERFGSKTGGPKSKGNMDLAQRFDEWRNLAFADT